jgi:hypothetical protein
MPILPKRETIVVSELWAEWVAKGQEETVTAAALLDEYKDAGYWGRHYSTVRLTLGTFFLTAAGGMVYHQWDHPNALTAVGAIGIAVIGFTLFVIFSFLTFHEMNRQLEIASIYRAKLGKDEEGKKPLTRHNRFFAKTAVPLGLPLLLIFVAFTCAWALKAFKEDGVADTKLQLSVQVGTSSPVTVEVPVKVTPKK